MNKVIFGALAGITATTAMTCFMRVRFKWLKPEHRYPLPPRELTDNLLPHISPKSDAAPVAAHFAYGALAGALYPILRRRKPNGCLYGLAVWAASYLGWIPLIKVLKPATRHPAQRNLLMIVAHLVWGGVLQHSYEEISRSSATQFAAGWNKDTF